MECEKLFEVSLIFSQCVGALAAAGDLYATTHKNDRRFMIVIVISSLVWAAHYALLGAWSAVGADLLTSARYLGALYLRKTAVAVIFMSFYLIAIPFTYDGPIDILPYAAGFISTYALFFFHGVRMRLVFIVAHVLWVAYAFTESSVPGVFLNAIMVLSHIRTISQIKRDA